MANRFLSNITINDAYTFPSADGTNGQVIGTDGDGNLSFVDQTTEALTLNVTVKNVSGGSLAKGTIVHASPSASPPSGNVVEVIAADYDDAAKMPAIGVLNETIADEAEGQAIMFGAVSGIDTSSFSAGDELWVGNNGAFTNTKPATAGQLIQKIAVVIKSHASNGLIKIFGAGRTNDVPLPLYVDNTNQRVGIGIASPSVPLHVVGDVNIGSGNLTIENASNPSLILNDTTNNLEFSVFPANNYVYFRADNSDAVASTRMVFQVDGSEVVYYNQNQDAFFANDVNATTFIGDLTGDVTGSASLNVLKTGDSMTGNLYFSDDTEGIHFGSSSTRNGAIYFDATLDGVIMQQTQGTDWTRLKVGDISTGNYKFEILGGNSTDSGEFNGTGWDSLFTINGDGDTDLVTGNLQVGSTVVITTSRNLTNIGTGSFSGDITFADGKGIVSVNGAKMVTGSGGGTFQSYAAASNNYAFIANNSADVIQLAVDVAGNGWSYFSGDLAVNQTTQPTHKLEVNGTAEIKGSLYLNAQDSLGFEDGKHWITYNDGEGNFNIRVGHKANDSVPDVEETTEAGYVFHDEWHQGAGLRQFNVSNISTAVGDLEGTDWSWLTQIDYDAANVNLRYGGSLRLTTTSAGVTINGDITADSFIKDGGTSSEFLKADGSVDSSTYITDITTQTDPKYVRSDVNDTVDGDLTFDGTATFNSGPVINGINNAMYLDRDASERNVMVFRDQGTEQWDLWMRDNGELSWESDVNGLFTVASDFRAEGDATITGKIVLGSTSDSDFLTGSSRMSVDGYVMVKGIVNTSETGTGPAAIVFGDGATYGSDQISFVTAGLKRLYIGSGGDTNVYQDLKVTGNTSLGKTSAATYSLEVYDATTNVVAQFESGDNQAWISVKDDDSGTYGAMLGCDADNNQNIILAGSDATKRFIIDNNGYASIINNAGSSNASLTFSNDDTGIALDQSIGYINFYSNDASTTSTGGVGGIALKAEEAFNTSYTPTYLAFYTHERTANDGTLLGNVTESMRIDSGGNVSIATTDNDYKLNIEDDTPYGGVIIQGANAPGLTLLDQSGTAKNLIYAQSTATAQGILRISADDNNAGTDSLIEFRVDGSAKMTIAPSGNVNILDGNLDLESSGSVNNINSILFANTERDAAYYTDDAGRLAFDENFYGDDEYGTGSYNPASVWSTDGGGLVVKNENGWGGVFTSVNSQWATPTWENTIIKEALGVGMTRMPNADLEVAKNAGADPSPIEDPVTIRLTDSGNAATGQGDTTNTWAEIQFYSEDQSSGGPAVQAKIGTIYDDIYSAGSHIAFFTTSVPTTAAAERVRITSAGRVGIGTDNPGYDLEVNGNAKIVSTLTISSAAAANSYLYLLSSTTGESELRMGDTDTDAGSIAYNNGSDTMVFRTNAGNRVFIDSSGRLLVGKTSSGYSTEGVEIRSDEVLITNNQGTPLSLNRTGNDGTLLSFAQDTSGIANINVSGNDLYFDMTAGGNVGIGVTSPDGIFHVLDGNGTKIRHGLYGSIGNRYSAWDTWIGNNIGVATDQTSGIEILTSYTASGASALKVGFNDLAYYQWSPTTLNGLSAGDQVTIPTPSLRVDTNGKVGIGVTTPDTKLHVADSSFTVMTLERPSVAAGGVSMDWINGDGFKWSTYHGGDERFYFDYEGSTKFVIESGGNVGIGVTDPDRMLTVDNTSLATNNPALRVKNNNSSSSIIAAFENDSDSIIIKSIGAGDYAIQNSQQGNGINMYDGTGGVELTYNGAWRLETTSAGGVDVNGEFRATADVIAYSSDERLKENIKPIENALDKVMQLKGVTFDWREKIDDLGFEPRNKKNDVGLIAQDVEKVLPQLIAPAPFDQDIDDDGKVISKSGENYKTVQYDRMVSLLVEAMKEQQKQIDELKNIIKNK